MMTMEIANYGTAMMILTLRDTNSIGRNLIQ